MRWYINRTGNAEGPIDDAAVVGMIQRGELQATHYLCQEGAQEWQPASAHPSFAQASAPAAPAPQQQYAPQQHSPQPQPHSPQPQAFGQPPAPQYGQPQSDPFGQAAAGVNDAANAFAGALGGAGGQQLVAPGAAAPGEGFFEQAEARNEPPSDAAKNAAGMAHLMGAAGVFLGCWLCGLGGVLGAFVGNILYKEQPKSPFALFHINQALVFQGGLYVVNLVLAVFIWAITFGVSFVSTTVASLLSLLYIINGLLWMVSVILPVLKAGKAKRGEWTEYPVFGAKVKNMKAPILK